MGVVGYVECVLALRCRSSLSPHPPCLVNGNKKGFTATNLLKQKGHQIKRRVVCLSPINAEERFFFANLQLLDWFQGEQDGPIRRCSVELCDKEQRRVFGIGNFYCTLVDLGKRRKRIESLRRPVDGVSVSQRAGRNISNRMFLLGRFSQWRKDQLQVIEKDPTPTGKDQGRVSDLKPIPLCQDFVMARLGEGGLHSLQCL